MDFTLVFRLQTAGADQQGRAIESLLRGVYDREQHQVLYSAVTGSGQIDLPPMAKGVLNEAGEPSGGTGDGARHTRPLAAQPLIHEFKNSFPFPHNGGRVFRFVLRLLPTRPEAYVSRRPSVVYREGSDHSTMNSTSCDSLATRDLYLSRDADALIVASVSCNLWPGIARSLLRHDAVFSRRGQTNHAATTSTRASWFVTRPPLRVAQPTGRVPAEERFRVRG